jgi:hypothetical protein
MNGVKVNMSDVRAVTRVVGRRTTLRYLAIGVGASLLAACRGKDDKNGAKGGGGGSSSGGGGGTPSTSGPSASPGVTGRAFAAFVTGTWKVRSETAGGDSGTLTATVSDGVWNLNWGGGETWRGTWAMRGGRLGLRVPESKSDPEELTDAAADNVPASVGDSVSLLLPWQPPGQSDTSGGERLDVNYTGKSGVLRIRHFDRSGSVTVHTCTRA